MLSLLFFSSLLSFSVAQSSTFRWSFTDAAITNSGRVNPCSSLALTVTGTGTPPYFLRAFIVGGSARLYPLDDALSWTVDLPSETNFLLSMVDSSPDGGSGGLSSVLTVTSNTPTEQCEQVDISAGQASFTMASNISSTSTLATCDDWGITVEGGTPPYVFTLMAPGAPIATNVTGSEHDNMLVYVNRAAPNGHLMAGVSDKNGQYAYGTALVQTSGGTDFECGARQTVTRSFLDEENPLSVSSVSQSSATVSSSSNTASSSPSSTPTAVLSGSDDGKKSNALPIALGVAIPVVVLIAAVLVFLWWRRRRQQYAKNTQVAPFTNLPSPMPTPQVMADVNSPVSTVPSTYLGQDRTVLSGRTEKAGLTVLSPTTGISTLSESDAASTARGRSSISDGSTARAATSPVEVRIVEVHHHHHHGAPPPGALGDLERQEEMPPPYSGSR